MLPPDDVPADIDKIPYDAPLAFSVPSKAWTDAMGGRANNRTDRLGEADVSYIDLTGKWIIISGANSGIGREAARTFARWGANIVLACREPRSHEQHPLDVVAECQHEAKAKERVSEIEWWQFDAADLSSVEAFANRWLKTKRPLDILANNAGIGSSPGGEKEVFLTKDGFEIIHQVNFLSHALLTMILLPSLAAAHAPRVVCSTSCFHFLGHYAIQNFNGDPSKQHGGPGKEGVQYYKNNKLYFQIWLTELQHRLLQHEELKHVTINGFHPGYVTTGIWVVLRDFWLKWLLVKILMWASWLFGITAQQGAMALVYVATAPECGPDPRKQGSKGRDLDDRGRGGGRYFNRILEQESMPHCRDRDARLRVWRKVAEELLLEEKGLLRVLGKYGASAP